jgi:hypothetical protein
VKKKVAKADRRADDLELRRRLWAMSEALVDKRAAMAS